MSIDFSEKHLALFQFRQYGSLGSRELIDGLQLQKDKFIDDFDGKIARPHLKGSKDTNEIVWKRPLDCQTGEHPVKPCLLVPKEEGSNEKIEVRKAKSVHFADSCGLALTSVSYLFDNEDELFAFKNFSRSKGLVVRNSFPLIGGKKKGTTEEKKSKLLNFVQPITLTNFQEKVIENRVCLENVVIREYSIFGTISVSNIDFQKNVFVRYTFDKWRSCHDAKGTFVSGTSTGKTDSFSFEIPVSGDDKGDTVNVEFCVCYETPSGTYWDNNKQQNYKILFYPNKTSQSIQDNLEGFSLLAKDNQFAGLNS